MSLVSLYLITASFKSSVICGSLLAEFIAIDCNGIKASPYVLRVSKDLIDVESELMDWIEVDQ